MKRLIEVWSSDTGVSKRMTRAEFFKTFGKAEGKEILDGYLPNIQAIEIKVAETEEERNALLGKSPEIVKQASLRKLAGDWH